MTHPALDGYPITVRIPIQWGDLDAFGHANNTVFFRLFESARIAYFRECGFYGSEGNRTVGPILHSTSCRFRRPLLFPDDTLVGTRVSDIQTDRFAMDYAIVSTAQDAVAGEGQGIIVSYDYASAAKAPIPSDVLERIHQIEGHR
jgi:acyl-CoA thioester hydrolase